MIRLLILSVFVLSNLVALIDFYINEKLKGDIYGYVVGEKELLLVTFLLLIASFILPLIFYRVNFNLLKKVSFKKIFNNEKHQGKLISYFILVVVLIWLYDIILSGKIAGNIDVGNSGPARLVSILFKPEYLVIIYYAVYRELRLAKLIIVLYFFGIMFQGWMSYLAYIFIIEIYYQFGKNINFKQGFLVFIIFVAGILLLPILRMAKLYYVGNLNMVGFSEFLFFGFEGGFSNNYIYFFDRVIQRLQHLSNYYYLLDNIDYYKMSLMNGEFCKYYCEGSAIEVFRGFFLGYDDFNFHRYFASSIDPRANIEYAWNITVGLFVWPFLLNSSIELFFFLFYISFLVFLIAFLTRLINSRAVTDLSWLVLVLLLCHGWFGDVVIYIQCLFVFIILGLVTKCRVKYNFKN